MKNKKNIWKSFIIYIILFLMICILIKDKTNKGEMAWLLLQAYSLLISIKLLKKYKFPRNKHLLIAIIYTLIYSLSTIPRFGLFSIVSIVLFFIGICSVISTLNNEKTSLKFLKEKTPKELFKTIIIGIIFGLIFGAVNYMLMKNNNEINHANILDAFLLSLSPALGEEILYRTVFYALIISTVKSNNKAKFTYWFMMMIPHIIPHTAVYFDANFINSLITWPIYIILYAAIFGLIFTVLQKKRDITSAMIAHGIVDFIRFCIFGLPR